MTPRALLALIPLLVVTACTYDVPLVADHAVPIDSALLGRWIPEGEAAADAGAERITVLRASETDYLVHHEDDGSSLYFLAWRIELDGVAALQLEVIGSDQRPAGASDPDRFSVVTYRIADGALEVLELNTRLIDKDLPGTGALQEAFRAHRDHPELFTAPTRYRKA